jgi:hypothetical protein
MVVARHAGILSPARRLKDNRPIVKLVLPSLVVFAFLSACSTKVYRDTWQPLPRTQDDNWPRLVVAALAVTRNEDAMALQQAGAELLGYHETRKGWALRAASTGGTHFIPIEHSQPDYLVNCTWAGYSTCTSTARPGRWSRIAVLRLSPDEWHRLPAHLIPTEDAVLPGVPASAVRYGCGVHNALGTTKCDSDWRIARPGE